MSGWKKAYLGDYIEVNPDSIKKDYPFQEIDYVDISSVGSGEIRETTIYNLDDAPSRAKRLVKRGDTIISTVRPRRRSFFHFKKVKQNHVVSTGFAVLRAKKNINPRYLYYVISNQRFTNYLVSREKGAAYPAISTSDIKEAEIRLPELEIQEKIATILGCIDDKIELNIKMNQTLEEMAMTLYKHWFTDFGPFQEGEFVETELGVIPRGWEVSQLAEYCEVITDGAHASPKEYLESDKVIATVKDMGSYSIDIDSCKHISDGDFEKLVKGNCQPLKGDVLLSKDGTMGKVLYMWDKPENLVTLSSIAILRPKYSDAYLYLYLRNPSNMNMIINGYASGSALNRLVLKSIKQIRILLPSENTLKEFDSKVKPLIDKIGENEKEIFLLKETRDYLLPKLISGEIDLSKAEETVENVMR
ncbi:restriction endonuclease subunit S [Oceanobacillus sojae]|uniref:restriction endonuclease subunit S n=1 Tax=Oceanobacillus sojae TaxID=582851 RepID=UPI00363F5976